MIVGIIAVAAILIALILNPIRLAKRVSPTVFEEEASETEAQASFDEAVAAQDWDLAYVWAYRLMVLGLDAQDVVTSTPGLTRARRRRRRHELHPCSAPSSISLRRPSTRCATVAPAFHPIMLRRCAASPRTSCARVAMRRWHRESQTGRCRHSDGARALRRGTPDDHHRSCLAAVRDHSVHPAQGWGTTTHPSVFGTRREMGHAPSHRCWATTVFPCAK